MIVSHSICICTHVRVVEVADHRDLTGTRRAIADIVNGVNIMNSQSDNYRLVNIGLTNSY